MKPYDPFVNNVYRKRGVTRDLHPLPMGPVPGTDWSGETVSVAIPTDVDEATWFRGARPLDRHALERVMVGDLEGARAVLGEDEGSLHNRVLIEHLLLFGHADDARAWGRTLDGWSRLSRMTGDVACTEIAGALQGQLEERAVAGLAAGRPGDVRWALDALACAVAPDQLDALESKLLSDEVDRFALACAELRERLLGADSEELDGLSAELREKVQPRGQTILDAARAGSAIAAEVGTQVALLWRTLARLLGDLPAHSAAGTERVQAMEEAFRWAPPALRDELLPELEHLRWRGRGLGVNLASSELLTPRRGFGRAAAAGLAMLLVVVALISSADPSRFAWYRNWRYPSAAINREIQRKLGQLQPIAQEIDQLDRQLAHQTEAQAPQLWHRREQLRERRQQLVAELQRLDAAQKR